MRVIRTLIIALVFTTILVGLMPYRTTTHAAAVALHQPLHQTGYATTQSEVFWSQNSGCGLAQVRISNLVGNGNWYCFWLDYPNTWGYLGMGDPFEPGNLFQVFRLQDPAAGTGWIRYYGGNYPQGTFCRFDNGLDVRFPNVEVTQIAINVPNSYHECP